MGTVVGLLDIGQMALLSYLLMRVLHPYSQTGIGVFIE